MSNLLWSQTNSIVWKHPLSTNNDMVHTKRQRDPSLHMLSTANTFYCTKMSGIEAKKGDLPGCRSRGKRHCRVAHRCVWWHPDWFLSKGWLGFPLDSRWQDASAWSWKSHQLAPWIWIAVFFQGDDWLLSSCRRQLLATQVYMHLNQRRRHGECSSQSNMLLPFIS